MGLESKLTTYLESVIKSESTYVCSKLFCRRLFFSKNAALVTLSSVKKTFRIINPTKGFINFINPCTVTKIINPSKVYDKK
jgi:hypothetical protein